MSVAAMTGQISVSIIKWLEDKKQLRERPKSLEKGTKSKKPNRQKIRTVGLIRISK